jgi:hypothetical protein
MRRSISLLLASVLLTSSMARANDNTLLEPLLSIEDLLIKKDRWVLQSNLGISSFSRSYFGQNVQDNATAHQALSVRYGMSSGLSLGLNWDRSSSLDSDRSFDANTLSFTGRYFLGRLSAWQVSAGFGAELSASHSDADLERERGAKSVSIDLVRFVDPLVLSSRFRYSDTGRWSYKGKSGSSARVFNWTLGMDFAVNRVLALYASHTLVLQQARSFAQVSDSKEYRQTLSLGASYRATEHISSSVNIGFGLANDSPATLSVVGRYEF